ncbi:MAG: NVEALA domain-containing protein [Paramuribaculum sp.]|nr:NVEALA domain-containing protein [Paramuribaculum sp.]
MKKKILVPAAIAALMGVGGYFAKSATTQNDGLSDLELANAEALANLEDKICRFSKVEKNESKNEVKCSGEGHQCCILD